MGQKTPKMRGRRSTDTGYLTVPSPTFDGCAVLYSPNSEFHGYVFRQNGVSWELEKTKNLDKNLSETSILASNPAILQLSAWLMDADARILTLERQLSEHLERKDE